MRCRLCGWLVKKLCSRGETCPACTNGRHPVGARTWEPCQYEEVTTCKD
jgi:hypothetical protein